MTQPANTYGLQISTKTEYGMRRVIASVRRRREGEQFPLNCSHGHWGDDAAELAQRDGLTLDGWVSDYSGEFGQPEANYRELHRVQIFQAKNMAIMLDRISKAIRRDEATEAGDIFMSFARAVGATWVCWQRQEGQLYSAYSDIAWSFRSIADGRAEFRRLIALAEAAQRAEGIKRIA